jgi:uncharacterized protein
MGSILLVLFLLAPGLYDKSGTPVYVGVDHELPDPAANDYFEPANHRTGQLTDADGLQLQCGLKEERRIIDAPQGRLGASLYYANDERRAAIILVHGADPETREMGFLIPYFACNGINVISYDQRGTGQSVGNWFYTGPPQKADDVAAVYDAFRSDRRVDAKRIGAWGGSNGGWVVPLVTLRRPIAFMILKSAASESLLSNADYEVKMEMIGDKQNSGAIAQALTMWHTVEAALYGKTSWGEADRVLSEDEKQPWFKDSLMPKFPVPMPQEMRDGLRRYITYDPSVTLTSTTTPALVLLGAVDKRVDSRDSYIHMQKYLRSGGDRDVTVIMYRDADHYLEVSKDGYHEVAPEHFVAGYPDIMITWLRQRGFLAQGP